MQTGLSHVTSRSSANSSISGDRNSPRRCEKNFRWRRPRHTLKGRQIADEIERVGLRLQLRKAQAEAGDIVLLYGDESEALTHPYLARAWARPRLRPARGGAGAGQEGGYDGFARSCKTPAHGNEIPPRSGRAGNICIQNPWPGSFQTIWKDPDRYVQQYYARYCKNRNSQDWRDWPYMAGDGAVQAADGYYRILGRIDDVINVAGHRLGTKEIESASLLVDEIAEAAVIPARDEIKGKVPDLYISLKPGYQPSEDIIKRVQEFVVREIGAIARPRRVVIVPDMPKTRSGKIMRRVLAAISNNENEGDISTLANPEIVNEIEI